MRAAFFARASRFRACAGPKTAAHFSGDLVLLRAAERKTAAHFSARRVARKFS
jgi:hypothetical protein